MDGALLPFALQLGILLVVGLVAYIAFRVGLRNREVVLGLDGFVSIRWGKWLPVTLRRIPVAAFTSFVVKKEARFAVTPRSNGQYRMQGMPDRWRLTAQANGRLVNLGSYTTEADAQKAVLFLSS